MMSYLSPPKKEIDITVSYRRRYIDATCGRRKGRYNHNGGRSLTVELSTSFLCFALRFLDFSELGGSQFRVEKMEKGFV